MHMTQRTFLFCPSTRPEFGPTLGERNHGKTTVRNGLPCWSVRGVRKTSPHFQQRYAQPSGYAHEGPDTCIQVSISLLKQSTKKSDMIHIHLIPMIVLLQVFSIVLKG